VQRQVGCQNGKPHVGEAIYKEGTGSAEAAVPWFVPRHGMRTMFIHYHTKPDERCHPVLIAYDGRRHILKAMHQRIGHPLHQRLLAVGEAL